MFFFKFKKYYVYVKNRSRRIYIDFYPLLNYITHIPRKAGYTSY